MSKAQRIGVIGAGTMGQGIAQVALLAGHSVWLYDVQAEALPRAFAGIRANLNKAVELNKLTAEAAEKALANLQLTEKLTDLVVDVAIEAAIEKLEIKRQLFAQLESINSPNTILASNTSSLSITRIAAGLQHPERVAGMHFFNPAHLMKLVEIVSGAATAAWVADALFALAQEMGKTPVRTQDAPGFIVNRVARPYYTEALKLAEEGVADVATIDRLLESTGFRLGPFRLMDLIGMDVNFAVTSSLHEAFHGEPRFRPSRLQEQKVAAGHLGKKSGKGFYDYPETGK